MPHYRQPILPEPRTVIRLTRTKPFAIVIATVSVTITVAIFAFGTKGTEPTPPTVIKYFTATKTLIKLTHTYTPIPVTKTLTKTQIPKATSTPDVWVNCNADYVSRLKVGDNAFVSDTPPLSNRLREGPNVNRKIIGYIDPGERVEILKGPSCSNGWVWWRVKSLKDGEVGWTSEGDEDNYWLVPTR
jgi:hypothetical protein